jgi:hypothetical protein
MFYKNKNFVIARIISMTMMDRQRNCHDECLGRLFFEDKRFCKEILLKIYRFCLKILFKDMEINNIIERKKKYIDYLGI